ncbi:MAG: hypothetical protein ABWY05_01440 [Noviherbaspirillum sp.]
MVWLTLPTAGASVRVSGCGAGFVVCSETLDSVFLVVTGAFNCAEAGSAAALDEDFSTDRDGLTAFVALDAMSARAGVDARFVEALPPDVAAGARETAFGAETPLLPDGLVGAGCPLCAGAVCCFTGFFIAFAMESTTKFCGRLPDIGLIG